MAKSLASTFPFYWSVVSLIIGSIRLIQFVVDFVFFRNGTPVVVFVILFLFYVAVVLPYGFAAFEIKKGKTFGYIISFFLSCFNLLLISIVTDPFNGGQLIDRLMIGLTAVGSILNIYFCLLFYVKKK